MALSHEQRVLRSRLSAHKLHATHNSRELTANARKAFLSKFEAEVDPDGVLDPADRASRAEHARKAYFTKLAFESSKARAKRAAERRKASSS